MLLVVTIIIKCCFMKKFLNENEMKTIKNNTGTRFFIRNHFISNLVLDSLISKILLELQGKS